jgi:hypothetical protein
MSVMVDYVPFEQPAPAMLTYQKATFFAVPAGGTVPEC